MEPSAESIAKPEVKFIYATHSLDNFDNIWQVAQNSDVILMEAVGLDEESRKQSEELINYASQSLDPQVKKNALWMLENSDDSVDFSTKMNEKVINEGKKLYYIDEIENGVGNEYMTNAKESINQATELLCSGKPIDAYDKYKDYVLGYAKSVEVRNDIVKDQVSKKIQENQEEWIGKKITVIQGTNHRDTYHDLKRGIKNAKLSRTFLNDQITFDIHSEIESRLINGKDTNIDNLIKRGFLAFYVIPRYNDETKIGVELDTADKIARNLSNEEVDHYFTKISDLQEYLKDKLDHKFTGEYGLKQLLTLGTEILEKYGKVKHPQS